MAYCHKIREGYLVGITGDTDKGGVRIWYTGGHMEQEAPQLDYICVTWGIKMKQLVGKERIRRCRAGKAGDWEKI